MTADARQSLTVADALMYPRQTGRARFAETVTAALIADRTEDGGFRVAVLANGKRHVFTDISAVRMRDTIRMLEAACASPEGQS